MERSRQLERCGGLNRLGSVPLTRNIRFRVLAKLTSSKIVVTFIGKTYRSCSQRNSANAHPSIRISFVFAILANSIALQNENPINRFPLTAKHGGPNHADLLLTDPALCLRE